MLGRPEQSPLIEDRHRSMPHIARHTSESLARAADPLVQEAIGLYLGFGRKLPAEIIDPSVGDEIFRMTRVSTPAAVASIFRASEDDKYRRAILRGVHYNLFLMRRKGGGLLPWEM